MMTDIEKLRPELATKQLGRFIVFEEEVDSTNTLAKALGRSGAPMGTIVLCNRQTKGRGRRGRNWESGNGALCFSFIWAFQNSMELAPRAVIACGTAVCAAVKEDMGVNASLKWPNDVLVDGKKLCGILCEADPSGFFVAGIGINVAQPSFDGDLAETATSLLIETGENISCEKLIAGTLNRLELLLEMCLTDKGFERVLEEYREMSCTVGKTVDVFGVDGVRTGIAVDMDSIGRLVIEEPGKGRYVVDAGDVSIRPAD